MTTPGMQGEVPPESMKKAYGNSWNWKVKKEIPV